MVILLAGLPADVPGSIRPVAAAPTARLWAIRRRIFDEILCWDRDYLLETSAVVKRYVQEAGTAWIRNLTALAAGHFLYVARITDVEMTAALARRRQGASLSPGQASAALIQFRKDFTQDYRVLEITIPLLQQASTLADSRVLRAYDAVQLASALEVWSQAPSLTLVSADAELNTAARAEGLAVDDPNTHP